MKKILSFFIGLGIALTAGCQESPDAAESLFGLSRLMGSRIFAISAGYQTADVCFRLASSGANRESNSS